MNIMKTQTKTTHMETGSIPKLLAQLAIPAVVAQVINLLYNIVDRIYIGHIPGIGAAALTGVGLFTPILMLLNAFAMLVGSGGAPRAAIADVYKRQVGIQSCFICIYIFHFNVFEDALGYGIQDRYPVSYTHLVTLYLS